MGEVKDEFDLNPALQNAISQATPALDNYVATVTMQQPVQTPGILRMAAAEVGSSRASTPPAPETKSSCAEDFTYVFWPSELVDLRHPFRRFVEACVYKLRKNAHKRSYDEADLPELFALMRGEIDELERAVAEGNSVETLLESSDVANMAMLIATVAMKRGIK
jgi:hypothetical protein